LGKWSEAAHVQVPPMVSPNMRTRTRQAQPRIESQML